MPRMTAAERKEARRETAMARLTDVTSERVAAEDRAARLRRKQFTYILRSHKAGLTYREIAQITGLTEIRIAQILRAEREAQEG